ncbi:MAG: tetratricopeptide repeat protein, partial [Chitinophagales bacterium]
MSRFRIYLFVCISLIVVRGFAQPSAPNKKDKEGNRTGKWIYYYDNENHQLSDIKNADWYRIAHFKKDKPVGKVYDYTVKDNKLIYEAEFKSLNPDTLHGEAVLYYTNGVMQYTYQYADNAMNGYSRYYYPSGKLQWECNYQNNYPHGTWIEYYENGKIWRTGTSLMGKKEGVFHFYRANGTLEKITIYKNDLLEGVSVNYDSAGRKTSEFPFKEDMLTGVVKYFNAEGEAKKFVMYYQDSIVDLYSMILSLPTFIIDGQYIDEAFTKAHIFEEYSRLLYGEENGIYGFAISCLSQLYFLKGDFEKGLSWTTKSYLLDKKMIGTDDEPQPDGWHLYSVMFSAYGNDSLALDATQLAIERSKLNGLPTSTTLLYMNRMASMQIALKRYDTGIAQYDALMDLCESMGDSVAFDCTSFGLEYAASLNALNKSAAALVQLEKLQEMSKGTGLEYAVLYETGKSKIYLNRIEEGLFNYKTVYDNFGMFQKDTVLHMEVIRDLGNYFTQTGNYAAAEKLFLESFELSRLRADNDSSDYYDRMMDVADFYSRVGRYMQAIPLAEEVTHFKLRELNNMQNDFFNFLNSDIMYENYTAQLITLGRIYESADMYESASVFYSQARDFAFNTQGDSSYNYINATAAMAGIALQQGAFTESENLYLQALALSEKYLGAGNVNYQTWRDDVAELYIRVERYDEALTLAEDVFNYRKAHYNASDPLVLASYTRLAAIYDALNQPEKARDLYMRNLQLLIENLNTNFSVMNAVEQEAFLSTFRYKFNIFNQFALAHSDLPGIAGDVLNFQIANKAMLLYSSISARRNFENASDTSIRETYREWLHTKQLIAKWNMQSAEKADSAALNALIASADNYEKQMNLKSGGNIAYVASNTWQDIQKKLEPSEVVVEYMRIVSFDAKQYQGAYYVALVLDSEMQAPVMVVLCNEDTLYALL